MAAWPHVAVLLKYSHMPGYFFCGDLKKYGICFCTIIFLSETLLDIKNLISTKDLEIDTSTQNHFETSF